MSWQPMLRCLRDERGIALVMALGIMFVLTLSLSTVILLTSASARHANYSNARQQAYALAEAGVNNALAVLNANYPDATHPYPGNKCLLNAQDPPAGFPGSAPPWGASDYVACGSLAPYTTAPDSSRPNETVTWWGTLRMVTGLGPTWVITSTGRVPNPTGPGASAVTRTLTAKVPVVIPAAREGGSGILNWIFSWGNTVFDQSSSLSSPLYVNGDLTLTQSASLSGSIFVTGNLTLENTSKITGGTLAVGGTLAQTQSHGTTVGTGSAPLAEAHVAGGCQWAGYPTSMQLHNPCLWSTATNAGDNVWATTHDTVFPPSSPTPPPRPTIDWPFWYQWGSPGPIAPCDAATQSGTTPIFETAGNTAIDNSVPTVFNLTPTASYTCKTVAGELSWNATTKVLTVKGTIYIDGSVSIDNGFPGQQVFTYNGQGTLYASGTFLIKGAAICAVKNSAGNGCDTSGWDPNSAALVVVAGGDGGAGGAQSQGSAVPAGVGIVVKSATFQGALFATNAIVVDTTASVQGPMVSINGTVNPGQTGNLTFPPIHFAPSGAPGEPPPPSALLAPREYGG